MQARAIEQAIDLALNQRASQAGAWHIEHVALDDSDPETGAWSPAKESTNASQAVNDPSVIAYIGPYNSGAVALALPITNPADLLTASPSATWPGLTQSGWNEGEPGIYYPTGRRNFLRLMPPDTVQASAAIQWALATDQSRVAILSDGSSYSLGLARAFKQEAAGHAGLAGDLTNINPPAFADIKAQLAGYTSAFYAPSTVANAIALTDQLAGSDITVFATDSALDPSFVATIKSAQNWRIVSNSAAIGMEPTALAFVQAYRASYGTEPTQFSANAYDITNLILDSVATKGNDRAAITSAVLATKIYQGASGLVAFDTATGDRITWSAKGYRPINGLFVQVESFQSTPTP